MLNLSNTLCFAYFYTNSYDIAKVNLLPSEPPRSTKDSEQANRSI